MYVSLYYLMLYYLLLKMCMCSTPFPGLLTCARNSGSRRKRRCRRCISRRRRRDCVRSSEAPKWKKKWSWKRCWETKTWSTLDGWVCPDILRNIYKYMLILLAFNKGMHTNLDDRGISGRFFVCTMLIIYTYITDIYIYT